MRRIGGEVTKEIEEEMKDTAIWIHELDAALKEELKSGLWMWFTYEWAIRLIVSRSHLRRGSNKGRVITMSGEPEAWSHEDT